MGTLAIMQAMCDLLADAAAILRKQAELLAMHGITTEDGRLESDCRELLNKVGLQADEPCRCLHQLGETHGGPCARRGPEERTEGGKGQ